MVSTFQPSRRHDVALAAFRLVHAREARATLVLVGDGQLGPELRARAEALGVAAQVRFAGYQGGESLVRWMQAFDELWVLGLGNDEAGRPALQGRAVGARVVVAWPRARSLPGWTRSFRRRRRRRWRRWRCARSGDRWWLPDVRTVAGELLRLYARAGARA
jgi:hypothetical protein